MVGWGANCKDHLDAGRTLECKKAVTMGDSGLSFETLKLRCKRWLVAGIDDFDWDDSDAKRTTHVRMGGKFMVEFANGLSEEACERIAQAQGGAGGAGGAA